MPVKVVKLDKTCESTSKNAFLLNDYERLITKAAINRAHSTLSKELKVLNFPRNTSNSFLSTFYSVPRGIKSIFSFTTRLYTSDNVIINDLISSVHSNSSFSLARYSSCDFILYYSTL